MIVREKLSKRRRLHVRVGGGERVRELVVGQEPEVDDTVRRSRSAATTVPVPVVTRSNGRSYRTTAVANARQQPLPALRALAAPGVEHEPPVDAVARSEAVGVVALRHGDAGSDDRGAWRAGCCKRRARAASGSDRNHTPRAPLKSGAKSGSRASGSSCRHGIRIVRSGADLTARERRPEHVGGEHERAVTVAVVEQVVEQLGDAQVVVHPTLLLGDRQRVAGQDAGVQRGALDTRRVDDGGEAPDRQRRIVD